MNEIISLKNEYFTYSMGRNINFTNKFGNLIIDRKEKKEFDWIMSTPKMKKSGKNENGTENL